MSTARQTTGQRGEQIARRYLETRGHQIVAVNWRCRVGEIDLITQQDETLVFTEVRTRRAASTDAIAASVGPQKQHRMIRAAQLYLSEHAQEESLWRIDLLVIALRDGQPPLIEHTENALDW